MGDPHNRENLASKLSPFFGRPIIGNVGAKAKFEISLNVGKWIIANYMISHMGGLQLFKIILFESEEYVKVHYRVVHVYK